MRNCRFRPFESLDARNLLAATLVSDINSTGAPSNPDGFVSIGDRAYFATTDAEQGSELWTTDGTPLGTRLLADLIPGPLSHKPFALTSVDDRLYFATERPLDADPPLIGQSRVEYTLWTSDGTTEGTQLLRTFERTLDSGGFPAFEMAALHGNLYFIVTEDMHQRALWTSDGTVAGTQPVIGIGGLSVTSQLTVSDRRLYFLQFTGASYTQSNLMVSDGTAAGTQLYVPGIGARFDSPRTFAILGDTVLFARRTSDGTTLFRADEAGPGQLASISIVKRIGFDDDEFEIADLTVVGDTLYFTAFDGSELWRSDGTTDGTVLVTPFGADVEDESEGTIRATFNSQMLLQVWTPQTGGELWVSDGTVANTRPIADIRPGIESSDPAHFVQVGSQFYFTADDGQHGRELWISDGTPEGTHLVSDIRPGPASSRASALDVTGQPTALGNRVLLRADDGVHGSELWVSNGTVEGTLLLSDLNASETIGAYPHAITAIGDDLFFVANDDQHGYELWHSDGTAAGTSLVRDGVSGPASQYEYADMLAHQHLVDELNLSYLMSNQPRAMVAELHGNGYFVAADPVTQQARLWRVNRDGTQWLPVLDLSSHRFTTGLVARNLGDQLMFFEYAGGVGNFLWRTDGTAEGTDRLEIGAQTSIVFEENVIAHHGVLYFPSPSTEPSNVELWRSDGTDSGTRRLKDLTPGPSGSFPHSLVGTRRGVYLAAANPQYTNHQLWFSDGTDEGTYPITQFSARTWTSFIGEVQAANERIFFLRTLHLDPPSASRVSYELWTTDGTIGNEIPLKVFEGSNRGPAGMDLLGSIGDTLLFRIDDPTLGASLWKTDGTAEGTVQISDVDPCPGSGCNTSLIDRRLYFSGTDEEHGSELWVTDGTALGTQRVAEIRPGVLGSTPSNFVVANGVLYFTADDGVHGPELWRYKPTARGDLNDDQRINVADVDLLCQAVQHGSGPYHFDLDQNGLIETHDLTVLTNDILSTSRGDANLDGRFDSQDLVRIFERGEYEDAIDDNSTWESGDWNCDGEFDSADLVAAFQEGRYQA